MIFCRLENRPDHVVGDELGEPRDLVQEAEAAGLQRAVDADVGTEVQHQRPPR